MKIADKVVVVTGAGSGIGAAMVERFRREGARGIVVADIHADRAMSVAETVGGIGIAADVTQEQQVRELVSTTEATFGRLDLFCSNAGISIRDPDQDDATSTSTEGWALSWALNVMAHVYAARAALPGMIARREGYFLNTASAAGLLPSIGNAAYCTTKHAAVGFAKSLALTHRSQGIGVSVLCPQAVDTPMLHGARGGRALGDMLTPAQVAESVVRGLELETFLILPHEQVLTYLQRQASDCDRSLRGMIRLRESMKTGLPPNS